MAKKQYLSYQDIEASLEIFKEQQIPACEVGFCVLKAFGKSDADIRRYREGKGVLTTYSGLLIKGLFCYNAASSTDMTSTLESMKRDPQVIKATPKILAVSDGTTILAYDMRESESYENPLRRLYCDFAFFYPLCGVERFVSVDESPADVKAAEKLAKLHDELRAYNDFSSKSELHDLNIFIARLLFCFFAEDTGIFEENLFTGSIVRYTKDDGSDLADYLSAAFNVMDICERNADTMKIISQFPYVNGGLFSKHIQIPNMGFKARKIIIECGELNWQDINPDIFGSMIQAVVDPNVRANQGMHYTSVPNIMKVISPLFLDELRAEYQKQLLLFEEKKRLRDVGELNSFKFLSEVTPIYKSCQKLLIRISKMKFFDPACGSGNFLIITYKMLRLLEMDVLRLMRQIVPALDFVGSSLISLSQFYGIELLDFPHEIAMLSMWLAEHQMNKKLHDDFGVNSQALPLHNITQIQCGNACRLDWDEVCPHDKEDEVFVFGNPPYLGGKLQTESQKRDQEIVIGHFDSFKNLDYISNWFYKGALYIKETKARYAFVSTNSICQGEQVAMLWPSIFNMGLHISFAHKSFKWSNNAKHNAGVTCVILGLASHGDNSKRIIYDKEVKIETSAISPYLVSGSSTIVKSENASLSNLPLMEYGNMPLEGGFLKLSEDEKKEILEFYPQAEKFIRPVIGGEELIKSISRFCLWIEDDDRKTAEAIPPIKKRIDGVYDFRINGGDVARTLVEKSHQFRYRKVAKTHQIVIPCTSSEKRDYLQCAYYDADYITMNSLEVIYDGDISLFGIISSKMHMAWVRTVGGRLKTDYRYSAQLCYNTFPFPTITEAKRTLLIEAAEEVLLTRADHPEKTLAEMYDPDKMPQDLRIAHAALDDVVDSCYPGYPFDNDEARLECLFNLYEKMTSK